MEWSRLLVDTIPGADFAVIEGGSHFSMVEGALAGVVSRSSVEDGGARVGQERGGARVGREGGVFSIRAAAMSTTTSCFTAATSARAPSGLTARARA